METVKDQLTLTRAFIELVARRPENRDTLRLVMIGDGCLLLPARQLLDQAGMGDLAWLPGSRDDIPQLMRGLDIFVLPSMNEGISNTILEAMASGLPVIATRVGGNGELVVDGETGLLVPPGQAFELADAISVYLREPGLAVRHGREGRRRVERKFTLEAMVEKYLSLYESVLPARGEHNPQ
jgi:glycosyltransferase involved in cell wall biosynthesis